MIERTNKINMIQKITLKTPLTTSTIKTINKIIEIIPHMTFYIYLFIRWDNFTERKNYTKHF